MSHRDPLAATALSLVGPCLALCLQAACAQQRTLPAPDPRPLQGRWEAEGDSGTISVTIVGSSLHFYERPDHQFDTTFTLIPGSAPPELHATILDSPRTSGSVGERVVAIYEIEDGVLDIAAVDESDGRPASFENAISRYRLERVDPSD